MRPGEGNADDGDGEHDGRHHMGERQPPSGQHQPDDISDEAQRPGAEIVRSFNRRYGITFPEPEAVFTEAPVVLGTDGARKMSKSLGNSPDPLDVIRDYGADALRFTVIYLAPLGQDVLFIERRARQCARIAAGGNDDMFARERLFAGLDRIGAVGSFHERTAAVEKADLVLLEQVQDAVVVLFDDRILSLKHFLKIKA